MFIPLLIETVIFEILLAQPLSMLRSGRTDLFRTHRTHPLTNIADSLNTER
jgi:hypothetical protein